MAKKVTITGSNLLSLLSQAWGGTAESATTIYGTSVPAGAEWGVNKAEVERFIKEQLGAKVSSSDLTTFQNTLMATVNTALASKVGFQRWVFNASESMYYLEAFASQSAASSYDSDPTGNAALRLFNIQLPISTVAGDSYSARLATSIEDPSESRIIKERSLIIPLRFSAVKTTEGERINAGISGTLYIERSTNNWQTYTRVGSVSLPSRDIDSVVYDNVDVGAYVQEGEQQLRFYAQFNYQDSEDVTRVATSPYVTFGTITLTDMQLVFSANWQRPFSGDSFQVGYYVSGYGQMYLYVEIDDYRIVNGASVATSTETAKIVNITKDNLMAAIGNPSDESEINGLHTIRAWLANATDTTVVSDDAVSQILYFDESTATAAQKQQAYVMVSNMVEEVTPYVEMKVFEYAVYKYGVDRVSFVVTLMNAGRTQTYMAHDLGSIAVGGSEPHVYRNALPIGRGITTAYLYFRVDSTLQTSKYWPLAVDQTVDYTPTDMEAGGFIFNASSRSNEEEHPEIIINEKTGSSVEAEWSPGMKFADPIGYVESENDPKHLHIPAGEWLHITGYDPFSDFESMTLELDIKVSDVYDEKIPVLRVGPQTENGVLGFEMLPLTGYHMTSEQTSRGSQDFQMQEDERTHVVLNIVKNLGNRGTNFIRIFINGIINREYTYGEDSFAPAGGSGGFVIGSTKAAVDIYSIKVYKQALSSHNILQDRKSAIPDAATKLAFHRANDILGGDNTISYAKTKMLYSTMLWIPDDTTKPYVPNYTNGSDAKYSTGTLKVIFRYRFATGGHNVGDINYDLSRIYTKMKVKGQGTSSMTYWAWNWRFQFTDSSEVWSVNAAMEADELLLSNVGKTEDEWECYGLFEEGGAHATKLDAKLNWASSSQSHKMGMVNAYGALWKSIIGTRDPIYAADRKTRPCVNQEAFMFFIQDASGTEQENKIRFSNFFTFGPAKNDKATWGLKVKSSHYIVDGAQKSMYTLLEGSSNGRPLTEAKVPWIPEEVFYYFNTSDEGDNQNETFIYNGDSQFDFDKGPSDTYTYGSGKEYDVPKGFTRVSGSSVLWQETGDMSFDSNDIYKTNGNTVKFYRRAWNFAYLNTHHLQPIEGDYNTLISMGNSETLNQTMQYYVMNAGGGHAKGDCFRYNPLSEKDNSLPKWVNAGITKDGNTSDGYAVLNLFTDLSDYMPSSYNANDAISLTNAFIKARLTRYRGDGRTTGSSLYWDETDCDLCQAWGKVMAAKDNWCKNTYFKLRPDGLLGMNRDDDDTIVDKDNVGKTGTPYQVEEHDRYNDNGEWADADGYGEIWDEQTHTYNTVSNPRNTYWNSQDNVLFTLREQTRGGTRSDMGSELQLMVGTIFQTMAQLEGSVDAFFQKYFFSIQEYFPAVAYNEVARLLYEEAKIQMTAGNYTNNTDPMTQSLGDQLQGEKQWIKRRIPYMESYGQSSVFANSNGNGSLSFRTSLSSTDSGTTHGYAFDVTPHQFLYPSAGTESSKAFSNWRTRPGEKVTLPTLNLTQNNNVFIYGIDYLRSVGDFAKHPTEPNSSMSVVGARLTEWIINEDGSQTVQNRSTTIALTAPKLQRLIMRNCTTLGGFGSDSLTQMKNIEMIDLRGCTGFTSLRFPETSTLTTLKLPSTLTAVNLIAQPNLETLTMDGYTALQSLAITGSPNVNAQSIVQSIFTAQGTTGALNTLRLRDVNWTGISVDVVKWMAGLTIADITGSINIYEPQLVGYAVDFSTKVAMIMKWGNVDDASSADHKGLLFTYNRKEASGIAVRGESYTHNTGDYAFEVYSTVSTYDNAFTKISFGVAPEQGHSGGDSSIDGYISLIGGGLVKIDAETGVLNVAALSTGFAANAIVTVTLQTYFGGNYGLLTAQKAVGIYDRQPVLGDYVFYDGTWSDQLDSNKSVIGIACIIPSAADTNHLITRADDRTPRLAVAINDASATAQNGTTYSEFQWGPYDQLNNSSYGTQYALYTEESGTRKLLDIPGTPHSSTTGLSTSYDINGLSNITGGSMTMTESNYLDSASDSGIANNGFKAFSLSASGSNAMGDGFAYNETTTLLNNRNLATTTNESLRALLSSYWQARYDEAIANGENFVVNSGMSNTLKLIQVRNNLLNSMNIAPPVASDKVSELKSLANLIVAIRAAYAEDVSGYPSKWSQLLFPAASAAYAYEPRVNAGEALAEKFKKHNWFLPTAGVLARICWYHLRGYGSAANAAQNIFKPAYSAGKWTQPSSTYYWSSTEYNSNNAWSVSFYSGNVSNNYKFTSCRVRPVVAF